MTEEKLTEEQIEHLLRQAKSVGKSGKQIIRDGFEDRYPAEDAKDQEPMSVQLAKKKQEEGQPLSPQDRMALGFNYLHGKVEDEEQSEDKEEENNESEPDTDGEDNND